MRVDISISTQHDMALGTNFTFIIFEYSTREKKAEFDFKLTIGNMLDCEK